MSVKLTNSVNIRKAIAKPIIISRLGIGVLTECKRLDTIPVDPYS